MRVKKLIAGAAVAALVFSLETMGVFAAGYTGAGHHMGSGCSGSYVGYGMHHNPYCAAPGYSTSGVFGSSFSRANATTGNVSMLAAGSAGTITVIANPVADTVVATPVPAAVEVPAAAPNVVVAPPVVSNTYNGMYNGVHHNEYNYNSGYNGGHHSGGHH